MLCRCIAYIESVEKIIESVDERKFELKGGQRKIMVGRGYEWNWCEEEEIADLQGR